MAEVFFPSLANSPSDFIRAVARAKANNGPSHEKARRAYVEKLLGYIDGYEEYRLLLKLFKSRIMGNTSMIQDLADLERIANKFTNTSTPMGTQVPICGDCCPKE